MNTKETMDKLRIGIMEKDDELIRCKEQLFCMEREVNGIVVELKDSLNDIDEPILNHFQCHHNVCLQMKHMLTHCIGLKTGHMQNYSTQPDLYYLASSISRGDFCVCTNIFHYSFIIH